MGYMWKAGKGNKIRFWEDLWIGSTSLTIQYWELYCIVNEQNRSIAELWDGANLKCTFHRCVDRRLFLMWEELVSLVSTIEFDGEEDALVWQFQSSGIYSSQSLYAIINFRGIKHVYLPVVWKIIVHPRIHFFLWLLSKNKLLTRDNLEKRQHLNDTICLLLTDRESIHHLFFECVVARKAWELVSQVIGVQTGSDFESIAKLWLCNKNFGVINIVTSTVICWGIWKLRNLICFQGDAWLGMQMLWKQVLIILRSWRILVPLRLAVGFDTAISLLEKIAWRPEQIMKTAQVD
jgi:hypothetical protein